MLDYLQKYKELPEGVRAIVSSTAVMSEIDKLEKLYGVDLATIVVRVMINDLRLEGLPSYFALNFDMNDQKAKELTSEIQNKVLIDVMEYLHPVNHPISPPLDVYHRLNEQEGKIVESRQVEKKAGANFFFSPEDEEEVRMISKNIETNTANVGAIDLDKKIENVVKEAQVVFSSSFIAERFCQIIKTFLRGIRNKIETKDTLIKPFDAGGLGLEVNLADKIIFIAAKQANILDAPVVAKQPLIMVPEDAVSALDARPEQKTSKEVSALFENIGMRDFEYNLAAEIAKKEAAKIEAEIKQASAQNETKPINEVNHNIVGNLDLSHELAPLTPSVIPVPVTPPKVDEKIDNTTSATKFYSIKPQMIKTEVQVATSDPVVQAEPVPVEVVRPTPIIRVSNSDSKVRMDDVRFVPYIMDPIAELRYLTIVNFRRLSTNPLEASKKIKEKLLVLEKDKYAKKLEGIKALRLSPLNQLYLEMGQECIGQGTDVATVVERRQRNSLDTLSVAEFDAVMDLNRSLRF